jgi:hypothetical protein
MQATHRASGETGAPPQTGWRSFATPGPLDRLGAWVGAACAVHCLVLPVVVGVLPFLGLQFLAEEGVEYAFLGVASLVALLSALWGLHRHGALRMVAAFACAIGVVLLGFTIGEETAEGRVVMAIGAIALVASHRANRKLCESCPRDPEGDGRGR